MKRSIALIALLTTLAAKGSALPPPLPPGQYTFQHKFAEQPELPSIPLRAQISGFHIVLINQASSPVFPRGVIAEGTLMWHAASGQWIIGHSNSDRHAQSVGGCSDGPEVVDLVQKIYWTC